jgi:hypothetical protein
VNEAFSRAKSTENNVMKYALNPDRMTAYKFFDVLFRYVICILPYFKHTNPSSQLFLNPLTASLPHPYGPSWCEIREQKKFSLHSGRNATAGIISLKNNGNRDKDKLFILT